MESLDETAVPSQEIAGADTGPATTLTNSGDEMTGETPAMNAQRTELAAASSSIEGTTGSAKPPMSEVPARPSARPFSEEVGFSGDPSDLTPLGGDASSLMGTLSALRGYMRIWV